MSAAKDKDLISKEIFSVCPRNDCNALYLISDTQHTINCTNISYGKTCGVKLGDI